MKLHAICQNIAFNVLKIGDFVNHKGVQHYFYKITDKDYSLNTIEVDVYDEETGLKSDKFAPEHYSGTRLYKRN